MSSGRVVYGVVAALASALLAAGCGTGGKAEAHADQQAGAKLFTSNCAACHTLGSGELVDHIFDRLGITNRGQTSADGTTTVEIWSGCMGACQLGPMASVNGKYVGYLTRERVDRILDQMQGQQSAAARSKE